MDRLRQWLTLKLAVVASKTHQDFFLHLCKVAIVEAHREEIDLFIAQMADNEEQTHDTDTNTIHTTIH
jgi:uncharacterized protein YaiI (UPF0178 family)